MRSVVGLGLLLCALTVHTNQAAAFNLGDAVQIGGALINSATKKSAESSVEQPIKKDTKLISARKYADTVIEKYTEQKQSQKTPLPQKIRNNFEDLMLLYRTDRSAKIRTSAMQLNHSLASYKEELRRKEQGSRLLAEKKRREQMRKEAAKQREAEIWKPKSRPPAQVTQKAKALTAEKKVAAAKAKPKAKKPDYCSTVSKGTLSSAICFIVEDFSNNRALGKMNKIMSVDEKNCTAQVEGLNNYTLRLNNMNVKTITFGRTFRPELAWIEGEGQNAALDVGGGKWRIMGGDPRFDTFRLRKALSVIFSRYCKGKTSEF